MNVAEERQTIRLVLVRLLQDAHAGELAAAHAYRGHWRSVRRDHEREEIRRIEQAEWHHRDLVAVMLRGLASGPRRRRELGMWCVGRFFGLLCFAPGWFGPMYAAGRLEGMNVEQYRRARDLAEELGFTAWVAMLEDMCAEEDRHERWFGDRVRGHWLLRPTSSVFGWSPRQPS